MTEEQYKKKKAELEKYERRLKIADRDRKTLEYLQHQGLFVVPETFIADDMGAYPKNVFELDDIMMKKIKIFVRNLVRARSTDPADGAFAASYGYPKHARHIDESTLASLINGEELNATIGFFDEKIHIDKKTKKKIHKALVNMLEKRINGSKKNT
jgi:hypothetical protein